jgi:hypothetical protein
LTRNVLVYDKYFIFGSDLATLVIMSHNKEVLMVHWLATDGQIGENISPLNMTILLHTLLLIIDACPLPYSICTAVTIALKGIIHWTLR